MTITDPKTAFHEKAHEELFFYKCHISFYLTEIGKNCIIE